MGEFENLAFNQNNELLDSLFLWKHFIDDVLGLFEGSKEDFEKFVEWLNSLMLGTVKFKSNISQEKVEFLDLIISIQDGKLQTNMFIKPTNLQLYLDFTSNHPRHCKVGIIYGQALRIIERCSSITDQEFHLNNLKQKPLKRNYPEQLVNKQFGRAKSKNIHNLIFQDRSTKQPKDDKIRLVFTFNSNNPPLQKWIRESQRLLFRNDRAKKFGEDIQVTYKQPKNLKTLVSGPKIQRNEHFEEDPGCSKCGHCHACSVVMNSKSFKSTNTQRVYKIRQKLNCDTSYVIYLGTCLKCHGQYVGKSITPFKRRHSGHKQEVKNQYGGLGHHFGGDTGCGYANMSFILIEKVEFGEKDKLSEREVFWQHQLRCYIENGDNGHCYRKEI